MDDSRLRLLTRLKPVMRARIVARMKRPGFLALLILPLLAATPATAQSLSLGGSIGVSESFEEGFEFRLEDTLSEIWIATETEAGTVLKLRAGRAETDDGPLVGGIPVSQEGTVEYLNAIVEYRSSEVFGSTALYLGPGFYRQKYGALEESDWGVALGANAIFPITRHLGVTLDLGYHWINFEESYDFVAATAGLRYAF